MRTLITMVMMALFVQGAVAQVGRGTINIGPTFNFSTDSDDELNEKSSKMIIGVNASYFIIQNLGIGLNMEGQFSKVEKDNVQGVSNSFGIGPQFLYMMNLSKQFYVPIFARYLFVTKEVDQTLFDGIKGTGTLLGFGTGIEYVVGSKLGLRLSIGYEILSLEYGDFSSSKNNNSGFRSSIGAGINF